MAEKCNDGIYLIKIPFEDLYTASFILCQGTDAVILDSGASDRDAQMYIIPEVQRLGVQVKHLIFSHGHGDHMGGINALRRAFPEAAVGKCLPADDSILPLQDGKMLLHRYQLLHLPGHSADSMAVLDTKTGTLLTGDCLQLWGIGKYRNGISHKRAYLESIRRVRSLGAAHIIAAHAYDPLGQFAHGREEVNAYLDECRQAALQMPEN